MQSLIGEIENLSIQEKFFIYKRLQLILRRNQNQLSKLVEEANDIDKIKRLLLTKKEHAIEEMVQLLPCMYPDNTEARDVYLKIIPVFFSYVTLYDMKVVEALKLIDMLRVHAAFEEFQNVFSQWHEVFHRRRNNPKKKFSYKDETYVRDLCPLPPATFPITLDYTQSIGYGNVGLLRCFHRWLRQHRLHKYLYFFAMLSYEQIFLLDSDSLEVYIENMELLKITDGAKNKIVREVKNLRQRKQQLKEILEDVPMVPEQIESAIREVKRILRTPICIRSDILNENIPELLVAVIQKIFDSVMHNVNLTVDTMPIYGLFISVLKEAWNYNIFTLQNKELFNYWRMTLSDNLNPLYRNLEVTEFKCRSPVAPSLIHNIIPKPIIQSQKPYSPDQDTFQPNLSFGTSFYQCLEDISRNAAEYALK